MGSLEILAMVFYSVMSDVGLQEEHEVLLVLLCNLEGEIWSQSVVCVSGVVVMGRLGGDEEILKRQEERRMDISEDRLGPVVQPVI